MAETGPDAVGRILERWRRNAGQQGRPEIPEPSGHLTLNDFLRERRRDLAGWVEPAAPEWGGKPLPRWMSRQTPLEERFDRDGLLRWNLPEGLLFEPLPKAQLLAWEAEARHRRSDAAGVIGAALACAAGFLLVTVVCFTLTFGGDYFGAFALGMLLGVLPLCACLLFALAHCPAWRRWRRLQVLVEWERDWQMAKATEPPDRSAERPDALGE